MVESASWGWNNSSVTWDSNVRYVYSSLLCIKTAILWGVCTCSGMLDGRPLRTVEAAEYGWQGEARQDSG